MIVSISHHVLADVGAKVGGFDALRCLAWHVTQRIQLAVALISRHGVDRGEEGRGSEVSGDVGSRGGVSCALLAKRGARGRLMAAGATRARRHRRGAP